MGGGYCSSGIESNPVALEKYPHLIIPSEQTVRGNYIHAMKQADICIATTGLHKSIGWKMGEYVAASKAIISEPLYYEVPGDFVTGKNYLEFSSVEECLEQVKLLINEPKRIYEMQKENEMYYKKYGNPLKMIENTLNIAE